MKHGIILTDGVIPLATTPAILSAQTLPWQGMGLPADVQQQLNDVLRTVTYYLQSFSMLTFQHIKSHTGHPWNEFVDRAALHPLSHDACFKPFPIGASV